VVHIETGIGIVISQDFRSYLCLHISWDYLVRRCVKAEEYVSSVYMLGLVFRLAGDRDIICPE
jgi:hypothetical protein